MPGLTPAERSIRGRIAAHTSWANTEDPAARTAPARRAALERFEREVDPDGVLAPRRTRAPRRVCAEGVLPEARARQLQSAASEAGAGGMSGGDQLCPACGDPVTGPRGFTTKDNVDTACNLAHNVEAAPKGGPEMSGGDQLEGHATQQLRLGEDFPGPLVRRDDPDTSRAAGAAAHAGSGPLRAAVLALHEAHPAGLTVDELQQLRPDIGRDSLSRRRGELVELGHLTDSGRRRRTVRRRQAIVWQVVR